ncbi:MAG: thioredoxin family protein [bacterium]
MKIIQLVAVILVSVLLFSCKETPITPDDNNKIDSTLKMIFVELGSETCEQCKNMRPVMDSIQKKYGNQILVKFIDVIKNSQEAEKYKIEVMPTQVFLDTNNHELHRHKGFYSEDSIHIFLQSKGLKLLK